MRPSYNLPARLQTPRVSRYSLILILLLLAAAAALAVSLTQAQSANGVYDTDGDRLIEISNIEQLRAMAVDNNGDGYADEDSDDWRDYYANGFPLSGNQLVCDRSCNGYELSRSLDFKDPGSYRSGVLNLDEHQRGDGWAPNWNFNAIFEGNGHAIYNLYMDRTLSQDSRDRNNTGFFGSTFVGSVIRNIRLVDVEIKGPGSSVGGLVGSNGSMITNSSVTGRVAGNGNQVGGLVGLNVGTISLSFAEGRVIGAGNQVGGLVGLNVGTISLSFAEGSVTGNGREVGGLVGRISGGTVIRSYATGNVTGNNQEVGGLVGASYPGTVASSYATGSVTGNRHIGGLVGIVRDSRVASSYAIGSVSGNGAEVGGLIGYLVDHLSGSTVFGYWNTDTAIATRGIGSHPRASGVPGKTTAELQAPTSNVGIYATWSSRDWDFGNSSQYPALKVDINGDGVATSAEFGGQGRAASDTLAAGNNTPTGIWSDGTTMWVADYEDGKLYAYNLATRARDSAKDFDTLAAAGNNAPRGIWSDGTTMWVADYEDGKIYAYDLATGTRDSARDFDTLAAGNNTPTGLWSNGATMYVGDYHDNRLYTYTMPPGLPATRPGASITLDKESGPAGTVVTITGGGFKRYTTVSEINFGALDLRSGFGLSTDGEGAFKTTFVVPASHTGPHTVRVRVGETIASATFTVTEDPILPSAPVISIPIIAGDQSLTVSWRAPSGDASGITAYDLRYIPSGDDESVDANWTVVQDVWTGSGSLQYTLTGLTGGTQYDVQVRAVNSIGDGPWSATVTGTPAQTTGASATRSFSAASVAPGGQVVVTIAAANYGSTGGAVTETLPAGFSYLSSTHGAVTHPVDGNSQVVRFTLSEETSFTYTVTASDVEGPHTFSGTLRDSDRNDHAVGGDATVTVGDAPPGVTVSYAGTAPVRIGTAIPVAATFTETVTGFTVDDVAVGNGTAGNFSGSGASYTFDVTPNAIGQVTVDIAADVAEDADSKGNTMAMQLSLGIPYDDDRNGTIEKSEVVEAIDDYLFGDGSVEKSHVVALIDLYLFG